MDGNPAKRFQVTSGNAPKDIKNRANGDPVLLIQYWDDAYRERIKQWPNFCATEAEFIDLRTPPQLNPVRMVEIFGRIRVAQNPPKIESHEMEQLRQMALTRAV